MYANGGKVDSKYGNTGIVRYKFNNEMTRYQVPGEDNIHKFANTNGIISEQVYSDYFSDKALSVLLYFGIISVIKPIHYRVS